MCGYPEKDEASDGALWWIETMQPGQQSVPITKSHKTDKAVTEPLPSGTLFHLVENKELLGALMSI